MWGKDQRQTDRARERERGRTRALTVTFALFYSFGFLYAFHPKNSLVILKVFYSKDFLIIETWISSFVKLGFRFHLPFRYFQIRFRNYPHWSGFYIHAGEHLGWLARLAHKQRRRRVAEVI